MSTNAVSWSRYAATLLLGGAVITTQAQEKTVDWNFYGSIRLAGEAVNADNAPDGFDDYNGFRDAYTRLGVKATHHISDEWSVMGQLEIPFDTVNMARQSPYWSDDDLRISKLQINSPYGNLWFGRGWLAYYNYIAYPVDYFSSYYSGWATFASFRKEDTIYYSSPVFNGFQVALASTKDNGRGVSDTRNQYVLSYSNTGLNLALSYDDPQDGANYELYGLSASYSTGPWYIAAKYEQLASSNRAIDGKSASNLLLQYAIDKKNTIRGMIADVQTAPWGGTYGDHILHLGWDHQYSENLKFFAEYYSEQTTSAIANKKYPTFDFAADQLADSGGQVFTVGIRYDFNFD